MTLRTLALLVMAIGWWRIPRVAEANRTKVSASAVIVVVLAGVLAMAATPMLSGLDVDAETFRIASALVLVAVGAARVFGVGSRTEDDEHTFPWLLPLAYPVLIGPETVLVFLSIGADHGLWITLTGAVIGSGLAVLAARIRFGRLIPRLWVRAGGIAVIVLAVALLFDGLRAI